MKMYVMSGMINEDLIESSVLEGDSKKNMTINQYF